MMTIKNIIKVYNEETIDFFVKKSDVAKKYNFTPQHIGNILNGKTKKNHIVFDDKVYHIEYEKDEKILKKYKKINNKKNIDNVDKKDNKKCEPFDFFKEYFDKQTIKTDDKHDFIKIKDLYNKFKCSICYLDRDINMRRNILTLKNMKEYFEKDVNTVVAFKKIFDRKVNGVRIKTTNVLMGYKFKEDDIHVLDSDDLESSDDL